MKVASENTTEKLAKRALEKEGWKVITGGWPDFLCIKGNRIKAVEVKSLWDRIRPRQAENHSLLRRAGLVVEIMFPSAPISKSPVGKLNTKDIRMIVSRDGIGFTKVRIKPIRLCILCGMPGKDSKSVCRSCAENQRNRVNKRWRHYVLPRKESVS